MQENTSDADGCEICKFTTGLEDIVGSICLHLVPVILPYPSISIHIHHSIINESTTSAKLDQGDQGQYQPYQPSPELGTEGSESPLVQRCGNATIQHRNMVVGHGIQNVAPVQVAMLEVVSHHHLHAHVVENLGELASKRSRSSGSIRILGQTKPNLTPTLSYWSPMTQVEGILIIYILY